jgi:hypothetical protein
VAAFSAPVVIVCTNSLEPPVLEAAEDPAASLHDEEWGKTKWTNPEG